MALGERTLRTLADLADQVALVIEVEEEAGAESVGGGGRENLTLNLHI